MMEKVKGKIFIFFYDQGGTIAVLHMLCDQLSYFLVGQNNFVGIKDNIYCRNLAQGCLR